MTNWAAVAAGVGSLPMVVVLAVLTTPPLVFLAGFACGLLAGGIAGGGFRSGLWHGILTGLGVTTLSIGLILLYARYFAPETAAVYPGFGMSLVLGLVLAVVLGVECIVGGLVGGAVVGSLD